MKKPQRFVNKVFVHCSDSDNPSHDNTTTILQWHLERGFSTIGYHFVITKDGQIHAGRNIEIIPSAQIGHNTGSIAICLTGKNHFSEEQFNSLIEFCTQLNQLYNKNITFHGHCEVSNKTCPNFDYKSILKIDSQGKMPASTNFLKEIFSYFIN